MFSSCFSLLSHLKSTLKKHSWQQFNSDLSPTTQALWRTKTALCFAGGNALSCENFSLPSLMDTQQLSFWQCCTFLPTSVTTQWLMLLSFSITFSTAPCVSPGPLVGSLSMDSGVYCFSTPRCPLFLLPLSSFCSHYMLCSPVPCSHGVALFHVPNDCSSLLEKCLLKTHCPYIKEWNKEELVWLGEPGKYSSSAD